jgi:glucan phosphoethanolaminetransferase (alkaline phosphatase superfamily)
MNNTNLFFISYSVLAFSTVFALSLYPSVSIDIYLALFAIEFFITSELASPFVFEYHKRIVIEVIMLIIFGVILIERISQILLEAAL